MRFRVECATLRMERRVENAEAAKIQRLEIFAITTVQFPSLVEGCWNLAHTPAQVKFFDHYGNYRIVPFEKLNDGMAITPSFFRSGIRVIQQLSPGVAKRSRLKP